MTGLWQVEARQDAPPSTASSSSLTPAYVENWSLWLDLKILARTVGVVFSGTGSWSHRTLSHARIFMAAALIGCVGCAKPNRMENSPGASWRKIPDSRDLRRPRATGQRRYTRVYVHYAHNGKSKRQLILSKTDTSRTPESNGSTKIASYSA